MPRCIKMAKLMQHSLQNRQMATMITVKVILSGDVVATKLAPQGKIEFKLMS